ncbi:MAG: DNA polymerase III subunit chi [Holosporaceae bacterium]|jgi:DNA polymerase-3 subunit chi|nr:DNA polymerase III subunit chi [Holosporaceae bacterium]
MIAMPDYSNTEFVIYATNAERFLSVVLGLLEKVHSSGKRCIFFSPLEERIKVVDKALWTFSTNAFIPHGDKKLGFCDQQPIYFTDVRENPNKATVLMMLDSFDYSIWENDFEKIIFVVDSGLQDKTQLAVIDELRSDLKKNTKNVKYWEHSSKGWIKLT